MTTPLCRNPQLFKGVIPRVIEPEPQFNLQADDSDSSDYDEEETDDGNSVSEFFFFSQNQTVIFLYCFSGKKRQ
jgi:hypothetical protein